MNFLDQFLSINKPIFEACELKSTAPVPDTESQEYHACNLKIEGRPVLYRQSKVTPTKNGQFVTIWKRKPKGPIQPFDSSDDISLLIITVKSQDHLGQFIFPKETLIRRGIFSINGKGGKRALRIYPPWDKPESQQAAKTQVWQLDFFVEISKNKSLDIKKIKTLYS